jgi:hypothetical protein
MEPRAFRGRVVAVQPRIGLHRSFDQLWHSYRSYALVLEDGTRIAIGPAAHAKQAFRIGDEVEGSGASVPKPRAEGPRSTS